MDLFRTGTRLLLILLYVIGSVLFMFPAPAAAVTPPSFELAHRRVVWPSAPAPRTTGNSSVLKALPGSGDLAVTPVMGVVSPLAPLVLRDGSVDELFLYVYRNVSYEPYRGFMRGAVLSLAGGRANDADSALALLVLLRGSGVSSRLVLATVALPGQEAACLVGVDTPERAESVLKSLGVPASWNGTHLLTERWMVAYWSGSGWELLDPSYKTCSLVQNLDLRDVEALTNVTGLVSDAYSSFSAGRNRSGVADSAQRILSAVEDGVLNITSGYRSLEEAFWARRIGEPPVPRHPPVVALLSEYQEPPDTDTYKLLVEFGGASFYASTTELAGRSLMIAAFPSDHASYLELASGHVGGFAVVNSSSARVSPLMMLDYELVGAGSDYNLSARIPLRLSLWYPGIGWENYTRLVPAYGHKVIVPWVGSVPSGLSEVLSARLSQLLLLQDMGVPDPLQLAKLTWYQTLGYAYWARLESRYYELSLLTHTAWSRLPSLLLVEDVLLAGPPPTPLGTMLDVVVDAHHSYPAGSDRGLQTVFEKTTGRSMIALERFAALLAGSDEGVLSFLDVADNVTASGSGVVELVYSNRTLASTLSVPDALRGLVSRALSAGYAVLVTNGTLPVGPTNVSYALVYNETSGEMGLYSSLGGDQAMNTIGSYAVSIMGGAFGYATTTAVAGLKTAVGYSVWSEIVKRQPVEALKSGATTLSLWSALISISVDPKKRSLKNNLEKLFDEVKLWQSKKEYYRQLLSEAYEIEKKARTLPPSQARSLLRKADLYKKLAQEGIARSSTMESLAVTRKIAVQKELMDVERLARRAEMLDKVGQALTALKAFHGTYKVLAGRTEEARWAGVKDVSSAVLDTAVNRLVAAGRIGLRGSVVFGLVEAGTEVAWEKAWVAWRKARIEEASSLYHEVSSYLEAKSTADKYVLKKALKTLLETRSLQKAEDVVYEYLYGSKSKLYDSIMGAYDSLRSRLRSAGGEFEPLKDLFASQTSSDVRSCSRARLEKLTATLYAILEKYKWDLSKAWGEIARRIGESTSATYPARPPSGNGEGGSLRRPAGDYPDDNFDIKVVRPIVSGPALPSDSQPGGEPGSLDLPSQGGLVVVSRTARATARDRSTLASLLSTRTGSAVVTALRALESLAYNIAWRKKDVGGARVYWYNSTRDALGYIRAYVSSMLKAASLLGSENAFEATPAVKARLGFKKPGRWGVTPINGRLRVIVGDTRVAVLKSGMYEEAARFLDEIGVPYVLVLPSSPLLGSDSFNEQVRLLIVPEGGFAGVIGRRGYSDPSIAAVLEENPASLELRRKLERFVSSGGTLLVFSQPTGNMFAPVPGTTWLENTRNRSDAIAVTADEFLSFVRRPPGGVVSPYAARSLRAYGWLQDQSCRSQSAYITSSDQLLSAAWRSPVDMNMDGFLLEVPPYADVLLRRRVNDMPSMIAYEYGEGRVVLTTSIELWATQHSIATPMGRTILANMIEYLLNDTFDVVVAAEPSGPRLEGAASLNMTLENPTEFNVSSVLVEAYAYSFGVPRLKTANLTSSMPSNMSKNVSFTLRGLTPGVWTVDYTLYSTGGLPVYTKHAALRLIVVGNLTTGPASRVTVTVVSDREEYVYGQPTTFTFIIKNGLASPQNVTLYWGDVHRYGCWDDCFNRSLVVPGGRVVTFNWTEPALGDRQNRLRGKYYVNGTLAGSFERGYWGRHPRLSALVQINKSMALRGVLEATVTLVNNENVTVSGLASASLSTWVFGRQVEVPMLHAASNSSYLKITVPPAGNRSIAYRAYFNRSLEPGSYFVRFALRAHVLWYGRNKTVLLAGASRDFTVTDQDLLPMRVEGCYLDSPQHSYNDSLTVTIRAIAYDRTLANVSIRAPTLAIDYNTTVQLQPGSRNFSISLPMNASRPGLHSLLVSVSASRYRYARSLSLLVPGPRILVSQPALDGRNITAYARNTGGFPARGSLSILLANREGRVVWSAYTGLRIQPGENASLSVMLPETIASGAYTAYSLWRGAETSVNRSLANVSGTSALLSIAAERAYPTSGGNITVEASVVRGSAPNSTLEVRVYKPLEKPFAAARANRTSGPGFIGLETESVRVLVSTSNASVLVEAKNGSSTYRLTDGWTFQLRAQLPDGREANATLASPPSYNGSTIIAEWRLADGLRLLQVVGVAYSASLRPDTMYYKLVAVSENASASLETRLAIDASLGGSDGLVFYAPSLGYTSVERSFTREVLWGRVSGIPKYLHLLDSAAPSMMAQLSLVDSGEIPVEVILASRSPPGFDYWPSSSSLSNESIVLVYHDLAPRPGAPSWLTLYYGPADPRLVGVDTRTSGLLEGRLLWARSFNASLEAGSARWNVSLPRLPQGLYLVEAALYNMLGQLLASNRTSTAYVADLTKGYVVSLRTDKSTYLEGDDVVVTVDVASLYSTPSTAAVNLYANGTLKASWISHLPGGGAESYTWRSRADGNYTLLATVDGFNATGRILTLTPTLRVSLDAPANVTDELFEVLVTVTNPSGIPVNASLRLKHDWAGCYPDCTYREEALGNYTLPPGGSVTVSRILRVYSSTYLTVEAEGTVGGRVVCRTNATSLVAFSAKATVTHVLEAPPLEGDVRLALNVSNLGEPVRAILSLTVTNTSRMEEAEQEYMACMAESGGDWEKCEPILFEGQREATVYLSERRLFLAANESLLLYYRMPLAPWNYSVSYWLSLESTGASLDGREFWLTVGQRGVRILGVPSFVQAYAGRDANLTVLVENIGSNTTLFNATLNVPGVYTGNLSLPVAPGRQNLTISFPVPESMDTRSIPSLLTAGGSDHVFILDVRGVAVGVDASLDRQSYREGDNATLSVTVRNAYVEPLDLLVSATYGGWSNSTTLTLQPGSSRTVQFRFEVLGIPAKISYRVATRDGRVLYMNASWVYARPAYAPSWFDMRLSAQRVRPGAPFLLQANVTEPGVLRVVFLSAINSTYQLSSGLNNITLQIPDAATGTYMLYYWYNSSSGNLTYSGALPVDVEGVEARVDGDTINTTRQAPGRAITIQIEFNATSSMPNAWLVLMLVDGEDNILYVTEKNVSLSLGPNLVPVTVTIPNNTSPGQYRLAYELVADLPAHSPTPIAGGDFLVQVSQPAPQRYMLSASSPYGSVSGGGWYPAGSTATVAVSPTVVYKPGGRTRHVLVGYMVDGGSLTPGSSLSLTVDANHTVVFVWRTEHLVNASSPYGSVSGGGWYPAGSRASIMVSPTMITLANDTRLVFSGWVGDVNSTSPNMTVEVKSPINVRASWRRQYKVRVVADKASILTVLLEGGEAVRGQSPVRLWARRGSEIRVVSAFYQGVEALESPVSARVQGPLTLAPRVRSYELTVIVRDLLAPLEGASVVVVHPNGSRISGTTGSGGAFRVGGLPPGRYLVSASYWLSAGNTSTSLESDTELVITLSVTPRSIAAVSVSAAVIIVLAVLAIMGLLSRLLRR